MTYRRTDLTDDIRALLTERLHRARDRTTQAREAELIDIYETWRLGLTIPDLARIYGAGERTIVAWKAQGEALWRRTQEERPTPP